MSNLQPYAPCPSSPSLFFAIAFAFAHRHPAHRPLPSPSPSPSAFAFAFAFFALRPPPSPPKKKSEHPCPLFPISQYPIINTLSHRHHTCHHIGSRPKRYIKRSILRYKTRPAKLNIVSTICQRFNLCIPFLRCFLLYISRSNQNLH